MASEDLEIEILLKMSLKSLMRCIRVSKRWSSIIHGEDFRKRYLRRSMTKPRVLFVFLRRPVPPNYANEVIFHSVHQEEEPLLLSSGQQQMHISPSDYIFTEPIRGLVCFRSGTTVTLYNPGTRQVMTSPEVQGVDRTYITRTYFGYDESTDVIKVLCATNKTNGYQVFTVGSDSWRPVICWHRHEPVTEGLCKGGVVYYGAHVGSESIVARFNVMSEEFSSIKLPAGVYISPVETSLVKYYDEIAIANKRVSDNGEFRILVRNEILGEWREEHIVIPGWIETVGDMHFYFVGTVGTGELVFAITVLIEGSHIVLYYDKDKQSLRKIQIEGVVDDSFYCVRTFLNHVDSPSIPM